MLAVHHHPLSSPGGPPFPWKVLTPRTTVYAACSASSFREPRQGRWSGEGGRDSSGSHIWLPSLPGAPALGQEQDCSRTATAATCASLSQSHLPWRLRAQKHHPAHVWLIQTSGHTEAVRSCSECSAEVGGPHQKSQQPNNHHHTPAPKTLCELKSQVQIRSLSPISVINTVCFHAALQILSSATALHR